MDASRLRTILWLRWRLTRNQWARSGSLNQIASFFVVGVGLAIGFGGALGGMLLGALALGKARPEALLFIWDAIIAAFLFFWMAGVATDIQRSETIDIGRMLHLPISIKQIFFINYIASHLSLVPILFVPGMLGLAVGLALGRSGSMVLLLPLVVGFVFLITAWTYCLRGWLVTLMVNPRRRRMVIAAVTFSFILISQLPYLFGNVFGRHHRPRPRAAETAPSTEQAPDAESDGRPAQVPDIVFTIHAAVPLLWVGYGAMSLAQGQAWPAFWTTGALFLLGGLGLRRAYRSTMRFYQGQATPQKTRAVRVRRRVDRAAATNRFLEKQLPCVPSEATAMALASFRSLMRAPEVKMALATNFLWLLIFGAMFLLRRADSIGEAFKPFVATGVIGVTFFGMVQLMFNLFGYDRSGFRALVLLPAPRQQVLLGKNLALLPIVIGIGGAMLLFVTLVASIRPVVVLATIMQLLAAFLLLSVAGNFVSVLVPYRVMPGSMKPTKLPTLTMLLMFAAHMLFPVAMLPIFLAPGLGLLASRLDWAPADAVNLVFSAGLLTLSSLVYRLSLANLGGLLQQREKAILQVVTHEVE